MLLLLILFAGVTDTLAQNVTIHGKNGSTLAARPMGTSDYDIFFKSGGFATWQHEQLALTMTASDVTTTTSNGQLANPANNIFKTVVDENTTLIQLAKGLGTYNTNYVSICLPKGYRFTGYSITFVRNSEKIGTGDDAYNASQSGTTTFGETTDKTFATYKVSKGVTYGGEAQTISRTAQQSGDDWDMENVLYFKMQGPDDGRAIITLTHAEFFFTAEADYTFVTPAETVVGRSAVDIPFATSKVDYGRLANESYDGKERMSYSSANITDVEAYLTLFEEESTKQITKAENTYDGVAGKIVDYKAGSIYSQGEYFRVGGKKANGSDVEQVYYIETPTYVTLPNPDATKSPIGYRIVGATIDYDMGTDQSEKTVQVEVDGEPKEYNTFYISATRDGRTFYLTSTATITEDADKKALWFIDENNYIRTGQNGGTYLAYSSSGLTTTTDDTYAQEWTISNNKIGFKYYYYDYEVVLSRDGRTYSFGFYYAGYSDYAATTHSEGIISIPTKVIQEQTIPAYKAAAFEIYKYDQTKKFGEAQSKETIEVGKNGKPTKGTITLSNLNNDAIKFGIKGTGLIKATLTLQALDPYIDQLDIVCQEQGTNNGRTLTQQFKATDFSVRGGKFNFYVPVDFKAPCQFTFENLYSKYGDNTYYTGTAQEKDGNARYSFVMSPYWTNSDVTDGTPIKNVYDTDPQASYTRKVQTLVAGDEPYKFNNAEDFKDGEEGGSYQEYVFNPGIYGEDNFTEFVFQQEEMDGETSKIAYLFTCDETKYNIAPTNATQHTYYAYYQMEITMQKRDYDGEYTWTKIYDGTKSHYDGMNADDASSWGLILSTSKASDNDEIGYLPVSKILAEINDKVGKTDYPKTKDQILYIDGSKLLSIVEDTKKEQQTTTNDEGEEVTTEVTVKYTKDKLINDLGANALVFLPYSSSSSSDNFAYVYNFVEEGGKQIPQFRGAANFVLTDKKPFYSPYDITIDAANEIRYERQVTVAKNGKVTSASIIMPFAISIDEGSTDGSHTNKGDKTWAFKLHQLSEGNCLGGEVKPNEPGFVYFPALTGVASTTANVPYLVKVNDQNVPSGDNVSFVIKQNGTTIKATTDMDPSEYTFMGQGGSGTYDSKSYTFTNSVGSYSGKEVAKNKNIFYFAKNMFLCSKDYAYDAPINVGPFRAYYATSGVSGGAKAYLFDIVFGENPNGTTGIDGVAERPDLMVVPGYGAITMTSSIDQNVRVNSLSGVLVDNAKLQAGESRTINVPAGVYVINGVKIIVK